MTVNAGPSHTGSQKSSDNLQQSKKNIPILKKGSKNLLLPEIELCFIEMQLYNLGNSIVFMESCLEWHTGSLLHSQMTSQVFPKFGNRWHTKTETAGNNGERIPRA